MLEALGTSLWCATGDHWMPGRVYFPVRMTLAKLADGRLWIHSPIAWTPELGAAVDGLGEVGWLVAPNVMHHMYLGEWASRYPSAQVYGAPGLAARRPDLSFHGELGGAGVPPWGDEVAQVLIAGIPKLNEVAFFHAASGALIVTDLVFNIHRWKGWVTGIVLIFSGARRKLAQSRLVRSMTNDRRAAAESARRMMAWPFVSVVPAHGDVVDGPDARDRMARAMAWMLAGAPAALPAVEPVADRS